MAKPIINGAAREWQFGDIIQITNENHHWYPALLIISEPKTFGCLGYTVIVDNSDDQNGRAYIRLNHEDMELVGSAVIVA